VQAATTVRRAATASSRARTVLAIVGLSVAMLAGSPTGALAGGALPHTDAPRGDGMSGAGGRKDTPAVIFGSFAAVGRYGVKRLPHDRPGKPPEESTDAEEASKELSDSGRADPTTKQILEPRGGRSSAPAGPGADVSRLAPVLGRSFAGMTGATPPDTNMAAGPHDVIIVTNAGVAVRRKNGTLLNPGTPGGTPPTLGQFFASMTTVLTFDPRAVFDPYIQRFWVIAGVVANAAGSTPAISRVVIALSNTDEAAGGWSFFQVDERREGATTVNQWCDYPMLGVSSDSIFISCNMFAFPVSTTSQFQYAKVRTMSKTQFLLNSCCLWWDTFNLREGFAGITASFTVQPATMFNAAGIGEFLVDAHGGGGADSVLEVWQITNAAACCIAGAQASPTWHNHDIGVGSFPSPPTAAQPSAAGVDSGGTRAQYAFWQNGRLSTGQGTGCDNGSGGLDACLAFTEINVSAFPASMSLVNDWAFRSAIGTDVYFPAVAANSAGSKTMVYTRSSPSENPTAAFIGIPDSSVCTTCVNLPEATLLAGSASIGCGALPCTARWGDYHGASPDPDGTGVWISGQGMTTARTSQVGLTRELGDFTPPVTTATINPPPDDGDWNTSLPVSVTLTTTDAGVGPWKITYEGINGYTANAPPLTTVTASTTTVQVNLDGETSIRYRGMDRWGNQEAQKSILVSVDRRTQKIVFASTRDGNPNGGHELYVMNSDGSNQVRLTHDDGDDTQPVLDRQGRVFFASDRDGDYEIYRLDRDGSVNQLTNNTGRDTDPAVKADGSKVAFASDRSGNVEIYTMNSDGTNVSAPVNPSPYEDTEPDWSPINPSNQRLAYVHNDHDPDPGFESDDYNIYLTNPGEFLGTPGEDRRPAWSPNARQVAATLIFQDPKTGNTEGDIVAYAVGSGSSYVDLTPGGGFDDSATWSPHGGWIAFSSDRTGDGEIHKMPSAGGATTNLTNTPGRDEEPDWVALDQGYTPGVELARIDTIVITKQPFHVHAFLDGLAPYALSGVRMDLRAAGGLQFLGATGPGADCSVDAEANLTCAIGTLDPGQRREIDITAIVGKPGTVAVRAFTSSSDGDPASATLFVPVSREKPQTVSVDVVDFAFRPAAIDVAQGTRVLWHFRGPSDGQSVTDTSGLGLFDSGPHAPGTTYQRLFQWAGTHHYGSTGGPASMVGSVGVPVELRAGERDATTVAWATKLLPAGLVFDVQYRFRAPDDVWSTWAQWRRGQVGLADLFLPDRGPGDYGFRARVRDAKTNVATDWSPSAALTAP
jgi:Tol biopolymer transport system component/plastocyanin